MSEITADNNNKKQRLGRGLGSLLGNAEVLGNSVNQPAKEIKKADAILPTTLAQANLPMESRVWQVAIDKLSSSQYQPRQHFEKDKLEELAQSIKQNGILQPIVARKLNSGKFEIIAGERRWRAAQLAGLHEVPVIFKTLSNKETLELAIIENIQREDLNPIEEAEAFQRLISEFGLTQQQASEKVGKDRATVANALRILNLSKATQELLVQNKISAGHAKVLLSLDDKKTQDQLAERIVKENLSVRALEKICKNKVSLTTAISEINKELSRSEKLIPSLISDLQKHLGTKVSIDYNDGKGKISIYFYSDDELNAFVEKLKP